MIQPTKLLTPTPQSNTDLNPQHQLLSQTPTLTSTLESQTKSLHFIMKTDKLKITKSKFVTKSLNQT